MTRSTFSYRTKPGKRDDLVRTFERLAVLEAASEEPGFLAAELHVSLEDEEEALFFSAWASPEHHERWLAHPVLETLDRELAPLLAGGPESRLYRVVEAAS